VDCPVPENPRRIDVGVGEIAIARVPDILVTSALGSCVGVALWDPFAQQGGLAHVMLPRGRDKSPGHDLPTRYATLAVPELIGALGRAGSPVRRLVAKIAGGASMFGNDSATTHVGDRNVTEVRRLLVEFGIPIRAEDVGGRYARTVELHLDSGTLMVRSYAFGVKEL
jgi:chemotaxis protein CheD